MNFPTWVEIDLDHIDHNVRELKRHAGPDVALLYVVKAHGYGHGAIEVGQAALSAGAAMLGVATLHEGLELRQGGIESPILVLSPSLVAEIDELIGAGLRPTISSPDFARVWSERAAARGLRLPVHAEVDTGMGRTGLDYDTAVAELGAMAVLPGLELEGIFTHFPDSDGVTPDFTLQQVDKFRRLIEDLEAAGLAVRWRHAANSAAVLRFPVSHFNMIRPGIAVAGIQPPNTPRRLDLRPALAFRCRVVQLRRVPAGNHISYGLTFVTQRSSKIAVIAAGYGHGLFRSLSNRGQVMVRGRRAPIVGRVTMDLTMIDVTDLPEVAVGDEVTVYGPLREPLEPGETPIRIEETAAWAETIPWEVFCHIDKRVVRKFLRGGQVVRVMTLVGERIERSAESGSRVIYAPGPRPVEQTGTAPGRRE